MNLRVAASTRRLLPRLLSATALIALAPGAQAETTIQHAGWTLPVQTVPITFFVDPLLDANFVAPGEDPYRDEGDPATLPVPLALDGTRYPSVVAEITTARVLRASPAGIASSLSSVLNREAIAQLEALGSNPVEVERLRALGISLTLDTNSLILEIEIQPQLRRTLVSSSGTENLPPGVRIVLPEDFSFGVTGTLFTAGDIIGNGGRFTTVNLQGFVNVGGTRGVSVLYGGDFSLEGDGEFFRRNRVIAIMDRPDQAIRYSAGDLTPALPRLSGDYDILGASVERNYDALQPLRNIRPIGTSSFLLERPAEVEIYVNGVLVRRFSANAGPVDVRDIPSVDLSNDVSIVIEDALGRREIDRFTLGSDFSLLARGLSEFAVSGGVLRDQSTTGFSYSDEPVISGQYAIGLTDGLTLGGAAVATQDYQNVSGSAAFTFFGGVALAEAYVSNSDDGGFGGAAAFFYRGDPFDLAMRESQFNFRAEYRMRDYRTLSTFDLNDTIKVDVAADYRVAITDDTRITAGASFLSRYDRSDRYTAYVGVQQRFGRAVLGVTGRFVRGANGENDFGAQLTFSLPLGRRTAAFASADTITQRARAEVRTRPGLSLPQFDYRLFVEHGPNNYLLGGEAGYLTSRFTADVGIREVYDRETGDFTTRGSARFQSGIAFADGNFAIGRDPGRGFVMVRKHQSLEDATVSVRTGSVGRELGQANGFGPAVVPVITPHAAQVTRVSTEGAPVGYDIGDGEYAALPGAASGTVIEVGSGSYRLVIANLEGAQGAIVSLVTGTVENLDTGEIRSFFTNRQGRVVLTAMAPGRYRLVTNGTGLVYEFEIADDAETMTRLGLVRMREAE